MNRLFRSFCALQRNSATKQMVCRGFAFRSDISPEVLYPNSKQRLYTPSLPEVRCSFRSLQSVFIHTSLSSQPTKEGEKFNGVIPLDKLKITYSRSSGPGGQNVNKVDTKVDLRFHVKTSEWIPQQVRELLLVEVSYLSVPVHFDV